MSDQLLPIEESNLVEINIIRSETALSRYPVHNLSRNKGINIDIRKHDQSLLWTVSYNNQYGQPGSLAYKLDTLVVNRHIEAAGTPVPKYIRLGSLRQIADELGLGGDTNLVKKALLQNASPFITAKVTYKTKDKSERTLALGLTSLLRTT